VALAAVIPRTVTMQPSLEIKEKNKNIINVHIELKGNMIDEQGRLIGTHQFGEAHVHLFNQDWVLEPLTDYIDSIMNDFSGDIKAYYRNLKRMLDEVDLNNMGIRNTIANLHYLAIDPQFRGQGLGRVFLEMLTESIKERYQANYIVLESCPVELNKLNRAVYEKERQRLDHMYTKFGFKRIKVKGLDKHYMYLNLDKMTPLS
jgi:GNAT superfamily N-acetyltransferase